MPNRIHNLTEKPLSEFKEGELLYSVYPYKGKQIHLEMLFIKCTSQKVFAHVSRILPPHDMIADLEKKTLNKTLSVNVQSCYLYGSKTTDAYCRAYFFKDVKSAAS